MNEPLESLYFNWLCAKVTKNKLANRTPSNSHFTLFRTLFGTEFVWLLSGDDNRAEDGLELRREFIIEADLPDYPDWRHFPPCSVFEMLIAFSRRVEFITSSPAIGWFWRFIENLGLSEFNDSYEVRPGEIEEILDQFIWRTYAPNGRGGMFPLNGTTKDQREIQIWYQFHEYLDQEDPIR